MNILVIGNGFDLAHGLPTKYGDFLEFCERIRVLYSYDGLGAHNEYNPGEKAKYIFEYQQQYFENWKTDEYIKSILFSFFIEKYKTGYVPQSKTLNEIYTCTGNNTWINFFLLCESYIGDNWIDFEAEISKVIQDLDAMRVILRKNGSVEELSKDKWEMLMSICEATKGSTLDSFGNVQALDKFTEFLNIELKKLIRALEIYIAEFISQIDISQRNSDISKLTIGHVLSFNYSDTYQRLYGTDEKISYDYIHGRADICNTLESNNMVLGIDEYLPKERRNKETEFIVFKKYYQRIYKGTGCEYKNWIYEIKESAKSTEEELTSKYPIQIPFIKFNNNEKHKLSIFGHSLDVTDKDILRDLILNDNVYTTIFYFNKEDLGSKIANLVKVIGQDELIRRTGGSTKTIEFKLQQDMVEI